MEEKNMPQVMSVQDTTEVQNLCVVGREHEQQIYARFLTQATTWLFLIVGEPGSGKSTLLRHLAAKTEKSIPVILLDFAQPWLRTDILTIMEKLAEQLQPSCGSNSFQAFTQKLADHRQLLAELGKKMNQMIISPERADREQLQEVTQAKRAYREQENAIDDVVEAFYALAETFQPERLIIMLDTSEWLSDPGGDETNRVGTWIMSSLLPELHERLQRRDRDCFFVITSRNRLHVDKMDKQDVIEHTLHPLEQIEVEQYLEQKGMQDTALRKHVYEISHGHPFYLMLIAELWQRQKEQPASFLPFLDEQQAWNMPALRGYLGERLLDKKLAEPLNILTRYGVLLRKFDLPMLQEVFPEFFRKGKEQKFTQLISASYILPREEYYAFDDLMRETLATWVRIHEPKKWRMYHERAWKYLSELASRHGTPYPVDGYYHALAFNEKRGMQEWVGAIRKAYADGTREVLGALFLVAYDKTLDLSPSARAVVAYEQGHFYYGDQQWDEALKCFRQALDLYRQAGKKKKAENVVEQARVCVGMADVQRFRPDRDLEMALNYYQHAYDLYVGMNVKGVDILLEQAHRLHEIGEVLRLQEKLEAALESYSKALSIFHGFGYNQDMAYVHRSMAEALAQLSPNSKEVAVEHYQQALELLPGEGDPAGRAETCKALGDLQRERQNWTVALQVYEQGLRFYQWDNNLMGQATLYQRMGETEQTRGKEITALAYYEKALEFYAHRKEELKGYTKEDIKYVTLQAREADVYRAIGRIKQQRREWESALQSCEAALNLYIKIEDETKRLEVEKVIDEIVHIEIAWTKVLLESTRPCRDFDRCLVNTFSSCEKSGDRQGAAYACQEMGKELQRHGEDMALVLEAYQYARWYFGEAGDERGWAYASQLIADVERSREDRETALIDYNLALKTYSELGNKPGTAYLNQMIGEVERSYNQPEQALQHFDAAYQYYQQINDQAGAAYVQKVRGEIEQVRSSWEKARNYYEVALALYQNLSDFAGEADVRTALGEIERASANLLEAQKQFEVARRLYQKLGDSLREAYLYRVIGDVQQAQQQWERALQSYDQALSFYKQKKMPAEQASIYQGRGDAERKNGRLDEALKDYQQAANLYDELRDDSGAAAAYRAISEIQRTHDLKAAEESASKAQIREIIACNQQTTPAPPLVAFARVTLMKDGQTFVDEYVLQVGIAQKWREEPGREETSAESEKVFDVVDPLLIGIKIHADSTIIWLDRNEKQLAYSTRDSEQQLEFPFKVQAAGHHTLDVDFSNKQRWVGTIRLEFDIVEQSLYSLTSDKPVIENKVNLALADDYLVDVFLRIRMDGNGRYSAEVTVDRGHAYKPFPIELTVDDVASHTRNLQEAIEQVSQRVGQEDFDIALETLAEAGRDAWGRVFSEEGRETIRRALKEGATIQVVVEKLDKFSIPWELFYDGPLGRGNIDIFGFWGMRYQIVRLMEFVTTDDPIIRTRLPLIGLIVDEDLQGVNEEKRALSELRDHQDILLDVLRPLDDQKYDHSRELEELGRFLREEELHILHLACHTHMKGPDELYLVVSKDFYIGLREIRNREFQIKHHPLVVLNACLTGQFNPLYTSNWVTLFWEKGARGVLATEARVTDSFAAKFLKKLYERLLTGELIGKALFETRRYFWKTNHDPTGLVYALYSSPSLRIEKLS
jgi:tetratricopeptide (TPR) repeat protein